MANDYVTELAALTSLRPYPKQGPFGGKAGCAIGVREGYLLAIGPAKLENKSCIAVIVRFPEIPQVGTLSSDIKAAMKGYSGKADVVQTAVVRWVRSYSFGKPKAQEIADLLPPLIDAIKKTAPAFDGKCEVCKYTATPEVTLRDKVPGYVCQNCQQKIQMELETAGREYDERTTDYATGLLYGLAAAAAGSLAWGGVAYLLNRIFLWGAIGIGVLIGKTVAKGAGKINWPVRVMIGLLTMASVLAGDALFYTFTIMKEQNAAFSIQLLKLMLANLWKIETAEGSGVLSMIFGLIGAGVAVYGNRRPEFKAEFERLIGG